MNTYIPLGAAVTILLLAFYIHSPDMGVVMDWLLRHRDHGPKAP